MSEFLFDYRPVAPTTWVYLSSFLAVGLFFKFSRVWSVRNLDLLMLLLLAPGLLLLHFGYESQRRASAEISDSSDVPPEQRESADEQTIDTTSGISPDPAGTSTSLEAATEDPQFVAPATPPDKPTRLKQWGYYWLLGVESLWLIRLLIDPALTRRPLLAPNLTIGGMAFMGIALFVFLMANVVSGGLKMNEHLAASEKGVTRMDRLMEYYGDQGPGYAVLGQLPVSANRTMAVISHTAVILGLILIGARHFDNVTNGIGAAMLYLMLPYTTQMTGRLDHFLPAALLVWAVLCYRRPLIAGMFLGAAAGCVYYPLFLLPVWLSFYQHRGWIRFLIGVGSALVLLSVALVFAPSSSGVLSDLQRMFGILAPAMTDLEGLWNDAAGGWDPSYRIPVMATFATLACSMALWPAHKSLSTLVSCSAALMLGTQFWHGWGGGLYIAWFLPLTLLIVFRPNLDDRVAVAVVGNGRAFRKPPIAA
jgi:hypothetical protein